MRIYSLLSLLTLAAVTLHTKTEWTALHEAIHYGRNSDVERLLQKGHPCSIEYLFLAIDRHKTSMNNYADLTPSVHVLIKKLQDLSISIDTKIPRVGKSQTWNTTMSYHWSGLTALVFAFRKYASSRRGNISAQNIPIIKALLEADADPNAKDQEGNDIDVFIQPLIEEFNGKPIQNDDPLLREMDRVEQENRAKLRDLLKHYRTQWTEKKLKGLEDEL